MDLKKLRMFEYDFVMNLTDNDIRVLELIGMVYSPSSYFEDSKSFVDLCYSHHCNRIYLHIGNTNEEEDRTFYQVQVKLMDGTVDERSFWGYGAIHFMEMEDLKCKQ